MTEHETAFEFTSVSKRYPDGTTAVEDLTLAIPSGSVTVFVGPSGCGKTTTLRMMNRMIEPTTGDITFNGESLKTQRKTAVRRRMGYVIQSGGLFPHRTVVENVNTVPRLLGRPRGASVRRARELLEAVGLDLKLADRYPSQLSGGQQQRVGVARALAADPEVLLMDEPFSAVDPVVRGDLQELVLSLQRELSKTVVMITHDIDEAIKLGDQVAILARGGRLAQYGTPEEILNAPADDFVAGFVGLDRGYRSLSFHPSSDLTLERVQAVRTPTAVRGGGPALVLDGSARPVGWVTSDRPGAVLPLGSVFHPGNDSMRAAINAALASPVALAVAVDHETGRFIGVVPMQVIIETAARIRQDTAIDLSDAQVGRDADADAEGADVEDPTDDQVVEEPVDDQVVEGPAPTTAVTDDHPVVATDADAAHEPPSAELHEDHPPAVEQHEDHPPAVEQHEDDAPEDDAHGSDPQQADLHGAEGRDR